MKHSAQPIVFSDKITVTQLYSTYVHRFPQNYSFSGERHDFWEIGYVLNGTVGVTSEDNIYKCKKGDLIIHPPNYFHTCWSTKEFVFFTLSFSLDNPDTVLSPCNIQVSDEERHVIDILIQEAKICFPHTEGEFYYNRSDESKLGYSSRHYQLLKNYLEILLLLVMKDSHKDNAPVQSQDAIKYNAIVRLLKSSICRNVTIETIANELFESPSNLKRIFHKYTNMGIMHYYNDLRLDHASRLISEGKSIGQIASEMRFSSQNYFSYFFKKATGKSPSEYRAAMQEKKD